MPHSFFIYFLLFLAAMAAKFVLCIEGVAAEVCEGWHKSEDVILSANFAGGAQLETGGTLDAREVVVLAF